MEDLSPNSAKEDLKLYLNTEPYSQTPEQSHGYFKNYDC